MPSPRKASNTGTVSSSLLLAAAPSLFNNFKCFQPLKQEKSPHAGMPQKQKESPNAGIPLKQEKASQTQGCLLSRKNATHMQGCKPRHARAPPAEREPGVSRLQTGRRLLQNTQVSLLGRPVRSTVGAYGPLRAKNKATLRCITKYGNTGMACKANDYQPNYQPREWVYASPHL